MKVLAGACLAVAGVAAVVLKSMSNQNWGGLWWLVGGAIGVVCIGIAVWLLRVIVERPPRTPAD
jgi:drug/metabolite transporter (DMT)-like permease